MQQVSRPEDDDDSGPVAPAVRVRPGRLPGGVFYDESIGPGRVTVPSATMTPGMWAAIARMPLVQLEHAVSLSLDREPGANLAGDAAMAYRWRLATCEAHRAAGTLPGDLKDTGWWLELAKFGTCAAAQGWRLPADMPRAAVAVKGRKRHNWKAPGALADMAAYHRDYGEAATAEKYGTTTSNIRNRLVEFKATAGVRAVVRQVTFGRK